MDFVEGSSNRNVFDIAYIPPDADVNTDEEDGDAEDIIANILPEDIEVFCSSESEDDVPLDQIRRRILNQVKTLPNGQKENVPLIWQI